MGDDRFPATAERDLLPPIFTSIARARLWRPFGDNQRLFATEMVDVHLARLMSSPEGQRDDVVTYDRLTASWAPRAELGLDIAAAVPRNVLTTIALNLIELSIDRQLVSHGQLQLGAFTVHRSAASLRSPDPYGVRASTRSISELAADLVRDRWISRRRFLTKLSYSLEVLNFVRPPTPYEVRIWLPRGEPVSEDDERAG